MSNPVSLEHMTTVRPHGVTDLLSANREPDGTKCCVAGVVTESKDAHKSSRDWFITFTLLDDFSEPLQVRLFSPRVERLPKLAVGDVIYVKSIVIQHSKFGTKNYGTMGVSSGMDITWLAFASKDLPEGDYRMKYATHENMLPNTRSYNAHPTIHEQQWAITLSERFKKGQLRRNNPRSEIASSAPAISPQNFTPGVGPNKAKKFSLIKDVQVNKFHDFTCEVVKKFFSSDILEVYVTDYTENNLLEPKPRPHPDDVNARRGPHGKMTLRVDLFPPHAMHADKNISEGDLVFLQNVRIKHSSNSRNLEGNIYHDPKYQTKICIWVARENEIGIEDLKRRRDAYWARESKQQATGKGKKSKKNKKDKLHAPVDSAQHSDVESPPQVQDEGHNGVRIPPSKFNSNVTVRGRDSDRTTLGDIVYHPKRSGVIGQTLRFNFPSINAKYRTSLRVVDFFPHDIRSFVQPETSASSPASSPGTLQHYKWHFWLICESGEPENEADANLKINVLVQGDHAQRLLGPDFDPTAWNIKVRALKDTGKASRMLSERLFLLWGELEETKRQFLNKNPRTIPDETFSLVQQEQKCDNYPFICNLVELGFPSPNMDDEDSDDARMGYQRIYMLVDTFLKEF